MKHTILYSAIGLLTLGGVAFASNLDGQYAGKSEAEITQQLESMGYEIRSIENEDDYLEAYALKDGVRYEVYIDPQTGKVIKIKEDD
ncbi:PepSY domain-containing protein [Kiloniella laminariae]|uniref:PepSY domain-containing protein n=1 Tax=Kiloniella laminariae TaxID=454162 RepID=A0ABT4LN90_9PROT|nr:PepSY domain-containing protein [Kiloniella laminariae]MCZ4281412.1 PepSY domain-containing protein [Kiloniella laminariae]